MLRSRACWLLLVLVLAWAPAALLAASRPTLAGTGGAVVSDEAQATEVGLSVLAAGGNAVDAAVAVALALAVVEPEAGNLGGGGFAVVKMGDEIAHLDFREIGPRAAHRNLYLDAEGEPRPEASLIGPLAAGVPGSPTGLYTLHSRFGRLPWPQVVAPAERLAAGGFVVSSRLHKNLEKKKEVLTRFAETAAVWLPGGTAPEPGAVMRLPALARTLRRYAADGPSAVTAGPVAAAVEEVSKRYGGILTAADLEAYEPVWRPPLRFSAFGWEVAVAQLPSAGGILVAGTAALLERLGWAVQPRQGAARAHLWAEALRRTYADRFLLGDPATTRAGAEQLLAATWLARRAASVDPSKASVSDEIYPWSGTPRDEGSDTTHLSVVDGDGNLVALTTTINGLFGCGLYVPEAGFFLNNEMDDFSAAPGQANLYGLIQGEANAVGAGKRMLSSQSPTIAWRGGEAIAVGGRGGSRIPTATLQILLNVWVDEDGLQAAVDRPRLHHQWLPDQLYAEPDALSPETRAALAARGHRIEEMEAIAQAHAVRRLEDGTVEAAADPRGPGTAGVVRPRP